ncbi:RidA family protein [Actinacidiphila sp. ITFR-21]|uniref:RidA family protein n=1 Tax=Actinacidiphila sp. ITFR-21 TaxID=3075199 RepID=UPI00288B0991|nr:RidA family protein [Streptomyces sp. ITFR-21]WNI18064.1 RidA family protein [Streptomyces sp. ITFR-21]
MTTFRNPQQVAPPLAAYSHQAEITGPVRWLVLSGQIGMTLAGEIPEDPIEQLGVALDNITGNLDAAGMNREDLVKLVFYYVGDIDLQQRRQRLGEWLGDLQPCMTVMTVAALATPDLRVEIEALACTEDSPATRRSEQQ